MKGTVTYYDRSKGFGFIKEAGLNDASWFFHYSNLLDMEVCKDDQVEFEEGEGRKGPVAIKVKRII